MKKQQINGQTLPINNRSFLNAKKFGFQFVAARKKYLERCQKKEEIIEDLGERPKPFKTILSFICIGIALVFAYIEAANVQTTIIGATGIGGTMAIIIGFAFAAAGLVAGDMLVSSWKLDEFTGKKKPTSKFYIAVAFALVYVTGQYWLASRAGVGTGEEMQEAVTTMKWFVLGIALAEILFGMAFLATAIKVFTLFIAQLRINKALRVVHATSRKCEEAWQRYIYECKGENVQEETKATIQARRFYSQAEFEDHDNQPHK